MACRLASLLGQHGGDYGTKDIQVLHYGIWPWRRVLNGACISISNLPENIAWQSHRPEAWGPLKKRAWGGRPTCHPQTPPLLPSVEIMWAIKNINYNKQDFDVESAWENQWIHCDVSASVYINVLYLNLSQVCILFSLLMNRESYVIIAVQWPKPQEILKYFLVPLWPTIQKKFHETDGGTSIWICVTKGPVTDEQFNLANLFSYVSLVWKAT